MFVLLIQAHTGFIFLFISLFFYFSPHKPTHKGVSLSRRNPLSWKTHFWPLKVKPIGHEVCVIVIMAHVISMEQSVPTKDESKNYGETSSGHDQTVVTTDAVSTSCDSSKLSKFCLFLSFLWFNFHYID